MTVRQQAIRLCKFHLHAAKGDMPKALSGMCDREPEGPAKMAAVSLMIAAMNKAEVETQAIA